MSLNIDLFYCQNLKSLQTKVFRVFYKYLIVNFLPMLPISLRDCLLSGLAVFGLKSSSLLQFAKEAHDTSSATRVNLINLYKVKMTLSYILTRKA